ncbi:MAG TPA: GNAT family N-acetyltransferase [Actinomycetota bacterium]
MERLVDLDLGGLRMRTLSVRDEDAALLAEATREETAPALWGPRPVGPYSLEAAWSALRAWDPDQARQVSFGVLDGPRLVAALGLMPDSPHSSSAELAYWVRPEQRRRGIAVRSVQALTLWAHTTAGLSRVWLEIDPDNLASLQVARRAATTRSSACRATAAPGSMMIQHRTPGTTASSGPTRPDDLAGAGAPEPRFANPYRSTTAPQVVWWKASPVTGGLEETHQTRAALVGVAATPM